MANKVLVVEDNKYLAAQYRLVLNKYGFDVKIVQDSDDFFDLYLKFEPNVIVIDISLRYSPLNGIQIMRALVYDHKTEAKIIVISGDATALQVKEIRKLGVYTFIEKGSNFNLNYLIVNIENAIKHSQNEDENKNLLFHNRNLKKQIVNRHPFIGKDKKMVKVKGELVQLALNEKSIIMYGEPGSGKHVAVNFYYNNSPRFGMPFTQVNCRKLTNEIDYLLRHNQTTKSEIIDNKLEKIIGDNVSGIIHFDELANLSNGIQLKLAKYLLSSEDDPSIPLIVFSTSFSVAKLKAKRALNSKLLSQLEENIVKIPSLKSRGNDYLLLMTYYLNILCEQYFIECNIDLTNIDDSLSGYHWPGNIVELKNFCKNIVFGEKEVNNNSVIASFRKIANKKDCQNCINEVYNINGLKEAVNQFEKDYIITKLKQNNWKMTTTAQLLKVERTTLYKKIKQYGIEKE